jgi:zinc transport system substrate-binding protein
MNTMTKRILPAALMALLALTGCGKKGGGGDKVVAASFYPMYIAALNVAENAAGVRVAVVAAAIYGCAHEYQLTPADAAVMETASALVINGGGLEEFLDKAAASNKNLAVVNASAGVDFHLSRARGDDDDDSGDGHGDDHDHKHSHDRRDTGAAANAHVWMSIDNHILQIENIAKGLAAWDNANAEIYSENARRYIAELTELRDSARRELAGAAGAKIALSHDGFLYLAQEFGLTVSVIIEKEHGVEPGAADVIEAIETIRRERPKALFVENSRRPPAIKTISEETGLPVFELDMAASGLYKKDAYIRAMEKNIAALKKALE